MKSFTILVLVVLLAGVAAAQNERATNVRDITIYVSPGGNSQKMADMPRGVELTIAERNNNSQTDPYCKVSGSPNPESSAPAVTGWTSCKPLVTASTPNADEVIFGEAVNSEQQAQQRRGRKGAAQDALRLYSRVADIVPNSPIAGEALWRAADIRWQLAKSGNHKPIDDSYMKDVIKRFPGTKWADLAAYEMLDNVLCDDSNGLPDCPLKESAAYEKYAQEHPKSPKAPDALYNAAMRQAAVADMYRVSRTQRDQSPAAHSKALALTQQLLSQYPEWAPRAQNLIYRLQQNIPVYAVHVEQKPE